MEQFQPIDESTDARAKILKSKENIEANNQLCEFM